MDKGKENELKKRWRSLSMDCATAEAIDRGRITASDRRNKTTNGGGPYGSLGHPLVYATRSWVVCSRLYISGRGDITVMPADIGENRS